MKTLAFYALVLLSLAGIAGMASACFAMMASGSAYWLIPQIGAMFVAAKAAATMERFA